MELSLSKQHKTAPQFCLFQGQTVIIRPKGKF